MKLAAIYNVWDGVELLRGSMERLKGQVDLFIIVWQDVSNYGEKFNPLPEIESALGCFDCFITPPFNYHLIKYTPESIAGAQNERNKRNIGLDIARREQCSHFLHLDCDEYYQSFATAKQQYIAAGAKGSVCKLYTYFKKPTLRFETEDGYYVPFIHELRPDTVAGGKQYPFYVDPTRRINETNVALLDTHMHHFSWVRSDIERKCRNSSAKNNIEKGTMLQDYHSPDVGNGFFVRDYEKRLVEVEDWFKLLLLS